MTMVLCVSRWAYPLCLSPSTAVKPCLPRRHFSTVSAHLSSPVSHTGLTGMYIASLVLVLCFTSCSSLARHIPSVSLCGFWSLPPHFYPTPDPGVTALLHSFSTSPLYVGFGSMESYLLDMDWTALFVTLEEGKWVCSTCTNIVIAFETYFSSRKTCNKCTVPMSGEWSSPASLLNTTIKTSAHPPDTAGVVSLLAVSSVFGHFAPRGERNCRCFASF